MTTIYHEVEITTPNYGPVSRHKFTGEPAASVRARQAVLEKEARDAAVAAGTDPVAAVAALPVPPIVTVDEVVSHTVTGRGWMAVDKDTGVCTGIYDDTKNKISPTEYRLKSADEVTPPFISGVGAVVAKA